MLFDEVFNGYLVMRGGNYALLSVIVALMSLLLLLYPTLKIL